MSLEQKIEGIIDISVRKGNMLGRSITLLRKVGITQFVRKIWIRMIYTKESFFPTSEMQESRKFFKENMGEIKNNLSVLSDDKSRDVYKKIIKFRCTHKLRDFPVYNCKNQYFDKEIVPISEGYVFADGGAYTGDTIETFIKFCNGKYSEIICFEPDPENIKALNNNNINRDNISIIPKGLWNEQTTLHFSMDQTASRISDEGDVSVVVTSIDMEEKCRNVNFIKMDIEGAELKALDGAIETIKRNKPLLAICIYHSNEDMINIIKWVSDLNLGYSLYVRHHSFDIHETVLYAIPAKLKEK